MIEERKASKKMIFGDKARWRATALKTTGLAFALAATPHALLAQEAPAAPEGAADAAAAPAAYVPMTPTAGKGMPTDGALGFQDQYSQLGNYAVWMHDAVLMPIITVITLFVLGLLLWVVVRYNRRANKVASKTSHNTLIEVVWTLVPVLILLGIAVPSIDLLAKQFKAPPEDTLTVKVTGYQWYWGYTYPDNGGFEVISKMLNEPNSPVVNPGVRTVGEMPSDGPAQLEVDRRLVLPAGELIRLQVIGADVIHSFAVPSLWFKLDAVPGRLNEKTLFIEEPGVYYGQCSELCGAKHAYMPIAIEALPRPQFEAWVRENGGTVGDEAEAAPAPASGAATPEGEAAPAA